MHEETKKKSNKTYYFGHTSGDFIIDYHGIVLNIFQPLRMSNKGSLKIASITS